MSHSECFPDSERPVFIGVSIASIVAVLTASPGFLVRLFILCYLCTAIARTIEQ